MAVNVGVVTLSGVSKTTTIMKGDVMMKSIINKAVMIGIVSSLSSGAYANERISKWYVRGDVGVAMPNKLSRFQIPGENCAPITMYDTKVPSTAMFDAAVGYNYNDYLRSDIMLLRLDRLKVSKTREDSNSTCRLRHGDSQSIYSTAMMMNGYVDFKRHERFIPYITAGIGVVYNKSDTYSVRVLDGSGNITSRTDIKGNGKFALAWSIGAGITYKICDNKTIDFAYRYFDLHKVQNSKEALINGRNRLIPGAGTVVAPHTSLRAHTFTVGIRHYFSS